MLDKFLVLLERFVVAHELIAANSARRTVTETVGDVSVSLTQPVSIELPVEGEEVIDTPRKSKAKPAAKPEPEDDLDDDEEPEEKPVRKADKESQRKLIEESDDEPEEKPVRKAKAKPAPKEEPTVDVAAIREDIKTIAKHIAAGESDQCADQFDELLEDYKVRTVTKLPDDAVEAFFKDAKTLVAKYYDLED